MKNITKENIKLLTDFCYYRDGNQINEILNNFKFQTLINKKPLNKKETISLVYETIYELEDKIIISYFYTSKNLSLSTKNFKTTKFFES